MSGNQVKFLNESVAVSKKDVFALCRKERIPLSIMLEKVKISEFCKSEYPVSKFSLSRQLIYGKAFARKYNISKERNSMKEIIKKHFRSVLSLVLVAAMVLMFAGCGQNQDEGTTTPSTSQQETVEKVFTFEVTELDGTKKEFKVQYDTEETVGEALVNEELISGEVGQYGLMVDTVNGQKYDYNADGAYWAFYINGEYAMTGVDTTPIKDGEVYSFVATKA